MNKAEKYIDESLREYCKDEKTRRKWAGLIKKRAIRFYFNSVLDSNVADEDLYEEDGKLVNLIDGLKYENDFIEKELKIFKS